MCVVEVTSLRVQPICILCTCDCLVGPAYNSQPPLNGPGDYPGSQSRFPPLDNPPDAQYDPNDSQVPIAPQNEPPYGTGYDQNEAPYGSRLNNYESRDEPQLSGMQGHGNYEHQAPPSDNYERDDAMQQYSRQNSMQQPAPYVGSHSHLPPSQRGPSPMMEAPLAQGSHDQLMASSGQLYAAGSQSRLNRSDAGAGSQVRLVGASGSERGSQVHLHVPAQPYDNRAFEDDDRLAIPRQDSAILAQGGYNLEVLRRSPSIPGGAHAHHYRRCFRFVLHTRLSYSDK